MMREEPVALQDNDDPRRRLARGLGRQRIQEGLKNDRTHAKRNALKNGTPFKVIHGQHVQVA